MRSGGPSGFRRRAGRSRASRWRPARHCRSVRRGCIRSCEESPDGSRGDRRPGGAFATGSMTAGGQRSVTAGGHAQDIGMNVGARGLGEGVYRPAGRLIAAGSAASKLTAKLLAITPGWLLCTMGSVTTAWARHAEQLVVEPRCRSASLSIGYAMAIHKPMAVGGTRVVDSGMRMGRPAGGSVVAAPDGATQERLVLLAAGLSPTRALPPPWRPSTPRRWAHLRLAGAPVRRRDARPLRRRPERGHGGLEVGPARVAA